MALRLTTDVILGYQKASTALQEESLVVFSFLLRVYFLLSLLLCLNPLTEELVSSCVLGASDEMDAHVPSLPLTPAGTLLPLLQRNGEKYANSTH
jgi:hypothetical protein